ncbi:hypothetical protein V6N13_079383 [Hibiscus sabdariffa]
MPQIGKIEGSTVAEPSSASKADRGNEGEQVNWYMYRRSSMVAHGEVLPSDSGGSCDVMMETRMEEEKRRQAANVEKKKGIKQLCVVSWENNRNTNGRNGK